jgi:flagellar hook protein FlgE
MSLVASLNVGVSALKTYSQGIQVISNNIANVSTTGYKASRAAYSDQFSNLLRPLVPNQANGTKVPPTQIGGGVQVQGINAVFSQGTVQSSGNVSDLAITGAGFFRVRDVDGGKDYVTRAGNFRVSTDGTLATQDGYQVQGTFGAQTRVIYDSATGRFNVMGPQDTMKRIEIAKSADASNPVTIVHSAQFSYDITPTSALAGIKAGMTVFKYDKTTGESVSYGRVSSIEGNRVTVSGFGGYPKSPTDVGDSVPDTLVFNAIKGIVSDGDVTAAKTYLTVTSSSNASNTVTVKGDVSGLVNTSTIVLGRKVTGVAYDGTSSTVLTLENQPLGADISAETSVEYFSAASQYYSIELSDSTTASSLKVGQDVSSGILGGLTGTVTNIVKGPTSTWAVVKKAADWSLSWNPAKERDYPVGEQLIDLDGGYSAANQIGSVDVGFSPTGGRVTVKDTLGNEVNDVGVLAKVPGLKSFNVGPSGDIIINLSNGQTFISGRVLLQNFKDPNSLIRQGNNLFSGIDNAGPINGTDLTAAGNTAGEDGLGLIQSASLEMSNVDLGQEFAEMITTQRSFQAGSRVISVSDQMLEEVVNLKR